jgi:hypothetical protein
MAAVELSAGSSDLMLGGCVRLQQPAQSLGGAAKASSRWSALICAADRAAD